MILHVGCSGFAIAQKDYFRTFGALEVQQTFYQPPRVQTARKWREQAGEGFVFCIKAWQLITHEPSSPTYRRLTRPIPTRLHGHYGSFRLSDEVRAAWQTTLSIAEAVDARVVLFQTPPSFTPTTAHRALLTKFFETIGRAGRTLAWEPRGVWEAREVKQLCEDLSLLHCVDPLQAKTTSSGTAYYRIHGLGGVRGQLTERDLERALVACEAFDEVFLFFNNVAMAADARRFLALVEELGAA